MARQRSPEEINQVLGADPEMQRLSEQFRAGGGKFNPFAGVGGRELTGQDAIHRDARRRMKELGITETPHDWTMSLSNNSISKKSWWERNMDWVLPAMLMGGPAAYAASTGAFGAGAGAGAASGGGGGAAATTPALSSLPVSSTISVPAAGSVPLGPLAGKGAMAGISKFMNSPFGLSLLGIGTDILGGLIGGEDEERSKNLLAGLPNSDPRKAVVDPVNQMYNAIRQANTLAQAFGQRAANPVRPRGPQMPGYGGRGQADVPLGGGGQGPQGLDVSALLAELQGALPERRPLPGATSPTQRRSPFSRG